MILTLKDHFIHGEWTTNKGKSFESTNPATGTLVWKGHLGTPHEIDRAVKAAREAFPAWSLLTLAEREKFLLAYQNQLKESKSQLAQIISQETGKPLWESSSEVDTMISKVTISIEAHQRRCGVSEKELPAGKSITRHRPHGVVGVLGPFNFPGHLPNGHIVPALLAGNTVVYKPSELTPAVAQIMIECWEKAKIPKGVINMVQGGRDAGAALAEHIDLNGLYFTGSYRTGKILSELFGKHPEKILALEMGGNNPLIVSKIDDPKTAALLTIQSAYLTSGQRCTCARRLIVPQGAEEDAFIELLIKMIGSIRVGKFTDIPEPFMGPVISEASALHLIDAQQRLESAGGKVLVSMHLMKPGTGLITPGLIDVTGVEERSDEEFFGPFLQLIRVPDFSVAIQEANQTKYGLSAGLLSSSKEEYDLFYAHSRAGIVTWNTQLTGASSGAPFGGIGHSGNHRPSAYYAADYCSYPVASMENTQLKMPASLPPGITI